MIKNNVDFRRVIMGIYLGSIAIRNNYVNFKPLAEYIDGKFYNLTSSDKRELLPDSVLGDINLFCSDTENYIMDSFQDEEYCVVEFEPNNLEANYKPYSNERNLTGYKIDISKLSGKSIRKIYELGYYYVISKDGIEGNYRTNPILEITDQNVYEDMQVVIELEDKENTIIGPFTVSWREIDSQYIIKTNLQNRKYFFEGYKYPNNISENVKISLGSFEPKQFIKIPDSGYEKVYVDVISDEHLLTTFKDIINEDNFIDGKLNLDNINEVINEHKGLLFIGDTIPDVISEQRFESLNKLLTDEKNLNDSFRFIADNIAILLDKYQEQNQYSDLVQKLSENPEFMNKIQRFRIISDKVEKQAEELQKLEQKSETIKQQIEEQNQAYKDSFIDDLQNDVRNLQDKKNSLEQEIDVLLETREKANRNIELQNKLKDLEEEVKYKDKRKDELNTAIKEIDKDLDAIFADKTKKALDFAFDGMLSSRMLKQAAEWENAQQVIDYESKVKALKELPLSTKEDVALIDYLVEQVKHFRPSYDRNTILNIFICYIQGFLTVFSGEPGTGKTSICNIVANILGLNTPEKYISETLNGFNANRYIKVAVEKGWTNKKDFIGYYNPLTKSFERNNRRIFDCLNILDIEARKEYTNIPFIILLDEANLSPMEYYWADYMNICDEINNNSIINLGDNYIFNISNNLRFLATINNDHTTEALSPRLIDRAWVIRLPKIKFSISKQADDLTSEFEIISWSSLSRIFDISLSKITNLNGAAEEIYKKLEAKFREIKINLSQRTSISVQKYWSVAQKIFENDSDYGTDSSIVALDYAIAQRILPRIAGSGKTYGEQLKEIAKLCSDNNLRFSSDILNEIIQKGEDSMQYYQYFA